MLFVSVFLWNAQCPDNDADVPVVLVHGIMAGENALGEAKIAFLKKNPNRTIVSLQLGSWEYASVVGHPARYLKMMRHEMRQKLPAGTKCIDLAGHSNGAFFSRAYIQLAANQTLAGVYYPAVRDFYSFAGPLNGFYCDGRCDVLVSFWAFTACFANSRYLQQVAVTAAYWRHYDAASFKRSHNMLTKLNGLQSDGDAPGRQQFASLRRLFMFWSSADPVIRPQASGHFGYFIEKDNKLETAAFDLADDRFGLGTLAKAGRAWDCNMETYDHEAYFDEEVNHFMRDVFAKAIAGQPVPNCKMLQ